MSCCMVAMRGKEEGQCLGEIPTQKVRTSASVGLFRTNHHFSSAGTILGGNPTQRDRTSASVGVFRTNHRIVPARERFGRQSNPKGPHIS